MLYLLVNLSSRVTLFKSKLWSTAALFRQLTCGLFSEEGNREQHNLTKILYVPICTQLSRIETNIQQECDQSQKSSKGIHVRYSIKGIELVKLSIARHKVSHTPLFAKQTKVTIFFQSMQQSLRYLISLLQKFNCVHHNLETIIDDLHLQN